MDVWDRGWWNKTQFELLGGVTLFLRAFPVARERPVAMAATYIFF